LSGGESPVATSGGAARLRPSRRPARLLACAVAAVVTGGLLLTARGSTESPIGHKPVSAMSYVFRNTRDGAGWRPPLTPKHGPTFVFRNIRDGVGWVPAGRI